MGMVHAAQKGELKDPSSKVAKLAKTMTKKSATEFASTKHKGLPKTAKKAKKTIKENYENKVGSLHIVQKPMEGCSCDGMVYEIDPVYGISKHNLNPDTIHGVYSTPEEAKKVAESLYSDHISAMKKLEEKKDTVSKKLNTAIDKLEKKRKEHMKMAKEDPKNASTHKANMSQISSQIEDLMDKLEKVSKSKKETEEEGESINEIGMFHDPIGFKKPELSDIDKIFTTKYKGNGVYDIFKNGVKIKTIDGEGNANAWINNEKRKLNEDKGSNIETLKSILGDLDGGYIKPKNGKFEVRYGYWEELPSSLINKLKSAGFDYDKTDTGSDNGVVYTISKKK